MRIKFKRKWCFRFVFFERIKPTFESENHFENSEIFKRELGINLMCQVPHWKFTTYRDIILSKFFYGEPLFGEEHFDKYTKPKLLKKIK